MSNFNFLQKEWSQLFSKMKLAEERVLSEPISTANYCRQVLEESIHLLFELEHLEKPYNKELINLMTNEDIRKLIPYDLYEGLHIVRKTGNNAAHFGNRITGKDALISIRYLYSFLKWFVQNYSTTVPEIPGQFDETQIPEQGSKHRQLKELQAEQHKSEQELLAKLQRLQEEHDRSLEKAKESAAELETYLAKEKLAKEKLHTQKLNRQKPITGEFTESQTRQHIIDVDLKSAGWYLIHEGKDTEYPVSGMPVNADNPKGNGFVDYVLWDDNGKPLAVVEAKRTSKDAEVGKHQAFLYADSLEKMHGQRPMIYYTNGYEIKLWDDKFYSSPRRVYGYYTKEELQWQIQKRATIQDIRKASINKEIAGRPYQLEAIQRVAETFVTQNKEGICGNKRRSLLVMATGTGKTRTAAAMVDMLFKNNWVKRVLFLADRNALVRQAKSEFSMHLPELTSIDLTQEKENETTRLVFSTYPTMMNKIDNARDSEQRVYGVGHFDLIIIDEAHRSIYNRYKAIFEYFDACIVGLTATPKDAIDHNTFELFGCSTDDPTFLYELNQAVPTYLTPYKTLEVQTKFIREGIKYNELSAVDKERYEDTFTDNATGLFPNEIRSHALNKWLFNKDTVFKVLDTLMERGLKIEGGDRLGRTIIFAVNQTHARFIVDCFTERYPEQVPGFIEMITNEVSHSQSLITAFCDKHKENLPMIAVSVDMMDTGIDAPRVLNLVFFKVVRSYAKFWQMIGRGTRLCPDIFGPNLDKEHFLIFDVCGNFDFFSAAKSKDDTHLGKPITQQLFDARLHLSRLLVEGGQEEEITLAGAIRDLLHISIEKLDRKRFQVSMKMRYVEEFQNRSRWNNLDSQDVHVIEQHLSELPTPEMVNELARRFDLMMVKLQIATLMMSSSRRKFESGLMEIAEGLSQKYTIPAISKARATIESLRDPDFYKNLTQKKLESIREELRDLVQYLDATNRPVFYSNITDSDVLVIESVPDMSINYGTLYRKRVESYIREHRHDLVISKLSSNQPITAAELVLLEKILFDGTDRGTLVDFKREYGDAPLGVFIRGILGLETKAAQDAFAEFLQAGNLRADQMTFIQNIINFLTRNGTVEPSMLFEPPFTDLNDQGLMGVFDDGASHKIISIVERINSNAIGA